MGLRKCFVSWNVSRQTMVQNDLKTKKEKSQRHEKCYIAFIRRNNDYNEPTRLDVAKLFVKLYFKIIPVLLCNIANRLVNENRFLHTTKPWLVNYCFFPKQQRNNCRKVYLQWYISDAKFVTPLWTSSILPHSNSSSNNYRCLGSFTTNLLIQKRHIANADQYTIT